MPIAFDIKEYQTVPLCQIISNLYLKSVLLKDRQLKYWENMNTELGQFRSPTILSPRVGSYQFEMKNINSSDFSLYPTMTIIVKDKFLLLMYLMKRKMGILIGTKQPINRCVVYKHLQPTASNHLFKNGNGNRSLNLNFQNNSRSNVIFDFA